MMSFVFSQSVLNGPSLTKEKKKEEESSSVPFRHNKDRPSQFLFPGSKGFNDGDDGDDGEEKEDDE